jgi:hypothetical protein
MRRTRTPATYDLRFSSEIIMQNIIDAKPTDTLDVAMRDHFKTAR